jgi:hypothetical protein
MTDLTALPGTPVTDSELEGLGFIPLTLRIDAHPIQLVGGVGCLWTTVGQVPDSPGLYAFTTSSGVLQHVTYVGLTSHLWMVTKGHLPHSGGARPGQRYGRPKYAGVTRKRVNVLVAAEVALGRTVRHWVRPTPQDELAATEEEYIVRWRLRTTGWNLG